MKLSAYLKDRGERMSEFVARLPVKCSQPQISRLYSGQCRPHEDLMIAIYVATDGAVAPNDWYSLPDIDKAKTDPVRMFVRFGNFERMAEVKVA
jgi:hypothetical protein